MKFRDYDDTEDYVAPGIRRRGRDVDDEDAEWMFNGSDEEPLFCEHCGDPLTDDESGPLCDFCLGVFQ